MANFFTICSVLVAKVGFNSFSLFSFSFLVFS